MAVKKNILICPLNWGLGHACRCVPVIQSFINAGANVVIAADYRPLAFLRKEFPNLKCFSFPGYRITYQRKGSFLLKFFSLLPQIILDIYKEHKQLNSIIDEYDIDIVVSDNRFGLWNKKVKSIFMTHQISIKSPIKISIFERLLYYCNKAFIKNYDECWIPDFEGEINLSGDLSHKYNLPIDSYFIGPLSRFKNRTPNDYSNPLELLVLLSGPEPQRTIFEEIILKQLENKTIKTIIVRGITEEDEVQTISENLSIYSHLDTNSLQKLIQQSEMILCRSGYSTIMDIAVFGKKAILVPTPGQTEQEYLAQYYKEKKYFYSVSQKLFNLEEALSHSKKYSGIQVKSNGVELNERVKALLL
ncbi:MAG: glycosyltransferase [Bacteroidetes bacterium]|nr:glycosyltransferase [Bacteroidota bacterium]